MGWKLIKRANALAFLEEQENLAQAMLAEANKENALPESNESVSSPAEEILENTEIVSEVTEPLIESDSNIAVTEEKIVKKSKKTTSKKKKAE